MAKKFMFILSVVSLLAIMGLIYLSYHPVQSEILNFTGQLFTIPIILFVISSLFYGLIRSIKTKGRDYYIISAINMVTLLIMLIFTILQS